jgi:hypothetical protein
MIEAATTLRDVATGGVLGYGLGEEESVHGDQ